MEVDVPEEWKAAAEEVRAHLCALRGGAPFLSPMDAWQLVRWLEEGVSVAAVLQALERAAEARRKARSRIPLSLGAARRHLGKPPNRPRTRPAGLGELAGGLGNAPHHRALAAALARIDGRGEEAERRALAAVRTFLEAEWNALGSVGRRALADEARAELGDLLGLVDEGVAEALVEETARDRLRQRYPALTAATLRELLADDLR